MRGLGGGAERRRSRRHSRCPPAAPVSWPPPRSSGSSPCTPSASTTAPTPLGPPILCADSVSRSARTAPRSNGIFPSAWIASTCSSPPAAWTMSAACRHRLDGAGLVVGEHDRDQRRRAAVKQRAQMVEVDKARARDPMLPIASAGNRPPAAPRRARSPRPAGAQPAAPCRAATRASAPTHWPRCRRRRTPRPAAGADTAAATEARASSTRRRALRPSAWTEDGLPLISHAAAIAALASGRSGVVAFQSR